MTDGELLVSAARDYLDTPWHHQGRLKGVGVDCIGLLVCSARDAGFQVEDVTNYPAEIKGPWLISELEAQCDRLPKAGPYELGDVLAFLFLDAPWHVGLITNLEPLWIIHAYISTAKVVEVPLHESWQRRIHSAWRLRY